MLQEVELNEDSAKIEPEEEKQIIEIPDFENNEDTYYQMCSKPGLTNDEKAVCKLFQTYLNEKVSDRQEAVNAANKELASLKNDLNKYMLKSDFENFVVYNSIHIYIISSFF
mgnify:CR=1 FL=1